MKAILRIRKTWVYFAVLFFCVCLWIGAGIVAVLPAGYLSAPELVWTSLSPHGKHVAIATGKDLDHRSLSIYDCKTQSLELHIERIDDEFSSVSFSSDDKFVAAYAPEDRAVIWELPAGREVASLPITCNGCDGVGNRLAPRFLKDSAYLLLEAETKDSSHLFTIWNIAKKTKECEFQCMGIAPSQDSESLIEWRQEDKTHSLFAWNITNPSKPILVAHKSLESDQIALCDDGRHFVSVRNKGTSTELRRQAASSSEPDKSISLEGSWNLMCLHTAADFVFLSQDLSENPTDQGPINIAVKTWEGALQQFGPFQPQLIVAPNGNCLSAGPNPASLFVGPSGQIHSSMERMRKTFVECLEQSDVFYLSPGGRFVIVRSTHDADWSSRLLSHFQQDAWQAGDLSARVEIWSLENQDPCAVFQGPEPSNIKFSADDSTAVICTPDKVLLSRLPRSHLLSSLSMRILCVALLCLFIFALVRKTSVQRGR